MNTDDRWRHNQPNTEQADGRPPEYRIEKLRDECVRLGKMNAMAYQRIADHEAALAAAVKKEREKCAEEFSQFAQAVRHHCRGRIGEIVANMALDRAAAIRSDK
jgi:hypothetical protein